MENLYNELNHSSFTILITFLSAIGFGRPYYRSSLWYTVSSVCRLSVVGRHLSVTLCIVAKRYVLAKNCLKE